MIAACLILRNSAETIERTLEGIRLYVDEINCFDTGSTDDTIKVLERLNQAAGIVIDEEQRPKLLDPENPKSIMYVSEVPEDGLTKDGLRILPLAPIRVEEAGDDIPLSADGLLGDFAWAREKSFAMASPEADWFFWLDDDDVVVGAEHIRPLAATAHPSCDGFVVFYDYAQDERGGNVCALWRERLIRRNPDWGWTNAVHEVWLPKPGNTKLPQYVKLHPDQMKFVHLRPPDRYPQTRNLSILQRVVEEAEKKGENPDFRTMAYMGTELMSQARWEEAVVWLERYITTPGCPLGDERSQVFHKLAVSLRTVGQAHAALEAEHAAIKERDDWAENWVGLSEIYSVTGQWDRAYRAAKTALELGQPDSMLILNPLEFTFVPFIRLSEACAATGRHEEAQEWLTRAASVQPGHEIIADHQQRFAQMAQSDNAVKAVMTLRETLVRHDENLKAWELLKNVPYIIAEDPRIVSARAMQREDVLHALKPEEYTRWYEDEPKESTVPDEWVPNAGDYIERAKFLLEAAKTYEAEHGRKPRMLDLGCNDAWMAGYLWKAGQYVCDGIELNKGSVEKAKGRIERFEIPGKVIQGNIFEADWLLSNHAVPGGATYNSAMGSYDIVSCFEVYEHVPNTDALLDKMEFLLAEDGVACLTTPNGAFEQGNIQMWHMVERKGHLRAVPAHELAQQLNTRGHIQRLELHSGNRLTYAEYKPKKKLGKIIFWGGPAWEPWSPLSIDEGGLGGSETALSVVSCRLGQMGYDVRVYTDASPGLFGGGIWRPAAAFDPTEEADAVIVMRNPALFDIEFHAPIRALWCHDHSYDGLMTKERIENMTHVVTLSQWEKKRFSKRYKDIGLTKQKSTVLRNGILYRDVQEELNYPDADQGFAERKPRVIYSSSADRGLDVLLEIWPDIREHVPEAELHVYYGWDIFDRIAAQNPILLAYKQKVHKLFTDAGGEEGGIFFRGRMGQKELREEMQQARVWAYPTAFLETSCITAMEARAAGLACVTSNLGALAETIGEHGLLIDWGHEEDEAHNQTPEYKSWFAREVVKLLSQEEEWTSWHDAARDGVEKLDWSHRVEEWHRLIQTTKASAAAEKTLKLQARLAIPITTEAA